MFVFIILIESFGHIKSIIFTCDLLFSKKLGLKLGFSRFVGFVIVGSLQMSAVCCDVSDWERCSVCPKSATNCFKSKALLFHKYCFPS